MKTAKYYCHVCGPLKDKGVERAVAREQILVVKNKRHIGEIQGKSRTLSKAERQKNPEIKKTAA